MGVVLLDRIADMYPDLDVGEHDRTIFLNSHGGKGTGKALGSIWEPFLVKQLLYAYDAFFPVMDDPETVRFISGKAAKHGLEPKHSGDALRRRVEERIVKHIYPSIQTAKIHGNTGFHQSVLALAAAVLDHEPETGEWIAFNERSGKLLQSPWRVTGGEFARIARQPRGPGRSRG